MYSQCGINEVEITISITTDDYPGETSWQLIDQNGGGWYINSGDLTQINTTYTYTYCVPDTNCYTFTIYDTWGDGICCNYGNGSYVVSQDGSPVVSGGSFASSQSTSGIGGCLLPPVSCSANEVEVFISITTDDYPLETSWQLVDQNGSGWFIAAGDLTQQNTTYTWSICVPDTNCYTYSIFDSWGDGICCFWGSGSYFINYNGSQVASGSSFLSSETTSQIGACIAPIVCFPWEKEIIITINTDDYPTEISWYFMDQYGGGWTNVPLTSSNANSIITWSLCVPDTNCYTFTILDSYGDGLCCLWGSGSYDVSYDGVNVASGGSFNFAEEHCGIGSCSPQCQITIPFNAISEGESCGSDVNNGCDDNFAISNFTITGVTDDWSWGYGTLFGVPVGPEFNPDLYIYMTENNIFYYYSDYYLDTWYPNSFSMFANQGITPPLDIQTSPLYTTPWVSGQTFNYTFSVYDDDDGSFSLLGSDDYIGNYTIPTPPVAATFSVLTSGGTDGNAYVDYTVIPPVSNYTPLSNNTLLNGNFWAASNIKDTDWFEFILTDSSDLTLSSIAEVPFNVVLFDAAGGCGNKIVIDSAFALQCDTINMTQTLAAGTYWLAVFPSAYSCVPCSDSADYLLDVSWVMGCNMSVSTNITPANCIDINGGINITINGGTPPFVFDWSDGSTSQNLINAAVGVYSVIITDANLCSDTLTSLLVTDYSSPLTVSFVSTSESLPNNFDGTIDLTVSGGISPLSYSWTGPNGFISSNEDILNLESGMYYIIVTDSNGCTVSDSVEVLLFSIDVGVSVFISPSTSCNLDSVEYIIVQINNYNQMDVSNFMVNFSYNGQIYSDSVLSVIPAGDSIQFTFSSTLNAATGGVYNISSYTSHNSDFDNTNDTSIISFTNYFHDFYTSDYEMGFEPNQDFSGWLIEDANNDSYSWNVSQYTGFNQSYGAFYNYNFNGLTSADDWLISQCFEFKSGVTYQLGFKYRAASAAFPEDISVNIGTMQQGSSLTTQLLQMNNIINIVYDSVFITFSVPADDTYYIGWHSVSNANMWRVDLDDINISMNVPNVYGCTDSVAINFNLNANVDDGSCVYCIYGCMDSTSFNFDSIATCPDLSCVSVMYGCTDPLALNYYAGANIDDGSCIFFLFGCTDSLAVNYNPNVLLDDGSCIYPILGCTDSTAINYDTTANTDDGSCLPYIYGCTDSIAINYYAASNLDDGSCVYTLYGCTDPTASNYSSLANTDDGSCQYMVCGNITGIYMSNVIHDRATFNWDNMNINNCEVDQVRIRYRQLGSSSWFIKTMGVPVGSGCSTSNISKTVLNLTSSTSYEYEFKIWYCNSSTVNWHNLDTFTTSPICENMINVVATPLSSSKVELCWDSVSTYSFVRLRYRVDSVGSVYNNIGGLGVFSPVMCKQKNGLMDSTTYRVIYRTWCSSTGGAYNSPQWDGPVYFTTPSSVRMNGIEDRFLFDIYPNPNRGEFDIRISNVDNDKMQLYIYNVLSEKIKVVDITEYNSLYHFNLSHLPKGVYMVELKSFNTSQFKRIIIQ